MLRFNKASREAANRRMALARAGEHIPPFLIVGGEPMIREDVIRAAGSVSDVLFPIFTNGTMMDDVDYDLLDRNRNLISVFSIEVYKEKTDERRGADVNQKLILSMERMQEKRLIYGASVTVTRENLYEVTSEEFVNALCARGCKAIFYVEYVPVSEETQSSAPQGEELEILDERLLRLRNAHEEMLFVSFTGEHIGECVLFEKRDRVERIMNGEDDANA